MFLIINEGINVVLHLRVGLMFGVAREYFIDM